MSARPTDKPVSTMPSEAEPRVGDATVPIWLMVSVFVLFFWGALYFDQHGAWFNPSVYAPYTSLAKVQAMQPASGADQALMRGKAVYEQICALCHGVDGLGKPGQAPPFAGSEWVLSDNVGHMIRIPLKGLNGPITVKGEQWNLAMPAMGAALSNEDLAAVLSYIRHSWDNNAGPITPEQVAAVREATKGRTQPWTAAELQAIP